MTTRLRKFMYNAFMSMYGFLFIRLLLISSCGAGNENQK